MSKNLSDVFAFVDVFYFSVFLAIQNATLSAVQVIVMAALNL